MSLKREQIPDEIVIKPSVPQHYHGPIRRAIRDYLGLRAESYPNAELHSISVLNDLLESDDPVNNPYDPVPLVSGNNLHPWHIDHWGSEFSETIYPIEDILVLRQVATSHSNWIAP